MPTEKTKRVGGDAVRLVRRPSTDEANSKIYFVTVNGSRVLGPLFPRSYAMQRFDDVVNKRKPSSKMNMSNESAISGPIDSYNEEVVTNDEARSEVREIESPLNDLDSDPIGEIDALSGLDETDGEEEDVLNRFDGL